MPRPPEPEHEEGEIGDDVLVYRFIPIHFCSFKSGEWEFQSGAFDNARPENDGESKDDMSVVLGDTLASLGRVPEDLPSDTLWAGDDWGVAVLEASYLKREQQRQEIRRTPTEEELAHGDVRGKKNSACRRRIKAHATWLVRPAAPPPE